MGRLKTGYIGFLAMAILFTEPGFPAADVGSPVAAPAEESLLDELERGFYSRLNILTFGVTEDVKQNSALNPNNILGLPKYQAAINPRADLNLNFRNIELVVKERFLFLWQRWEDGIYEGEEDSLGQFYLNEGYARYRIGDELFISYGRENLQWGPSVLLSSSNPFYEENGRNNPQIELPGLGYARAVWIPNANWSVSFIANTDKGRLGRQKLFGINQSSLVGSGQQDFQPAYALKVDWTGAGKYFSLIPAYREHTGYRVGALGGWNVSDAWLLYGEGAISQHQNFEIQAGASYTFQDGPTLNMEYYHNGKGCDQKQLRQCFLLGEVNSLFDPLFRRDYLMGQYTETKIWRDLNLNVRAVYSFDDSSTRLIGNFEYEVDDHWLFYFIANGFIGNPNSEFGSLLRYSLFAGGTYTF